MEYPFTTYSMIWDAIDGSKPNLGRLCEYFQRLFLQGVEDYSQKKSVSEGSMIVLRTERRDCDLIQLAKDAGYRDQGNYQHSRVQNYLLANDPLTMAIEIPLWDEEYHGHADLVRYLPEDKIHIPDFKPNAIKEKKAASQVFRYKNLLHKRTGIPLDDIVISYFDDQNAFYVTL